MDKIQDKEINNIQVTPVIDGACVPVSRGI
jgi:hypothetical protein